MTMMVCSFTFVMVMRFLYVFFFFRVCTLPLIAHTDAILHKYFLFTYYTHFVHDFLRQPQEKKRTICFYPPNSIRRYEGKGVLLWPIRLTGTITGRCSSSTGWGVKLRLHCRFFALELRHLLDWLKDWYVWSTDNMLHVMTPYLYLMLLLCEITNGDHDLYSFHCVYAK